MRIKSVLKSLLVASFLVACSSMAADSKGKHIRVDEKAGKVFIKKGERESSFSLNLPKNFDVEVVYKQSQGDFEIVAYQYVNVGDAATQIQVIDAKQMKLQWRKEIPGFNLSKPLVTEGALYFANSDYVARFDLKSGKIVWEQEGVNSKYGFEGGDEISIKDGVVHFSDKFKAKASSGQILGGKK